MSRRPAAPSPTGTSRARTPENCFGCGISHAQNICTLSTPLTPAPHQHSARSNYSIPSSPETQRLAKDVIRDGKSKLAVLDSALSRLQEHVQNIHRIIHHHQIYLVSILSLPDDVLLLVFEHLSLQCDVGSWTASAVCRRWRDVALSSTALWTRITFGEMYGDMADRERCIQRLKRRLNIQLERSGDRTLQLTLDTFRATGTPVVRVTSIWAGLSPVDILFGYAKRFDALELHSRMPSEWLHELTEDEDDWDSPQPTTFDLSALRKLHVTDESYFSTPLLCTWAPHLTDLTLQNIRASVFSSCISANNLAFNHLRRLALIACIFPANFLVPLFQLVGKELEELWIDDSEMTEYHMASQISTAVQLPALRDLIVSFPGSAGTRSLVANLQAPKLQYLRFTTPLAQDLDAIQKCVQHASVLKELIFDGWSSPHYLPLIQLLSELSSLETLSLRSIDNPNVVEHLLQALHWSASYNPLAPPPSSTSSHKHVEFRT